MSIILDALRKAEATRREHGGLRLPPPIAVAPPLRTKPGLTRPVVGGAALALIGVAAYFLWPSQAARLDTMPATKLAASKPASTPTPAGGAATTSAAALESSATMQGSTALAAPADTEPALPAPAAGAGNADSEVRMLSLEARHPQPAEAATVAPRGGSVEVRDLLGAGAGKAPQQAPIKPGTVEVRDLLGEEGLAPPQSAPQEGVAENAAPGAGGTSKAATTAAPSPPADAAPDIPTAEDLVANGEINPPNLTLDMHAYGPDPQQRFVYINMRRYRIGDTTSEGAVVEDITTDGVVLRFQGRRFLLQSR